jgi:Protein of unknown function, DUF481
MKYSFYKNLILSGLILFFTPMSFAQIINIEEQRIREKDDSTHWYGSINIGFNVQRVKETVLDFKNNMQIEYKNQKHLVLSLSNYNLTKAGSKDLVNSAFQHLRYNYKLKRAISWEAYGQIQNNQVQKMRLRTLAGTGLRFRLLKSKNGENRVYFGTSIFYEKNLYEDGSLRYFTRLSNYLSMVYRPNKSIAFQNTSYFQPAIDQKNSLRWSSETDIIIKITSKLSFNCSFNINQDNTLPIDIPRQTFNLMNGLKVVL